MPSLYLSPSTQEGNPYITGGSEEYYMNLLADELVPYLGANAIAYTRKPFLRWPKPMPAVMTCT